MKLKPGDIAVIIFFVISTAFIFISVTTKHLTTNDMMVKVVIEREVVDIFPISENIKKTYTTDLGSNTIVIEDGLVYIEDADCRDQICVDSKHGQYVGDAIVCLPNRFSIEIIGDDSSEPGGEIDAISQ